MDLVIDIQCIKVSKHSIVPKEIAIVALNGNYHGHWVVAPTIDVNYLNDDIRRENNWLSQNCHGFDYLEGEIPLKVVHKILRELTKSARKIYVRGSEKWLLLHKIIANEFINLEYDKDCPPFDKLSSNVYCVHHAVKHLSQKYRCALNNAFCLKSHLCSRNSYLNKNLIDLSNGQSSNIGDRNRRHLS